MPNLVERIFVRSELMPIKWRKWDESKASIGTHSSGGILSLFAKMWVIEFRFVVLCAFAMAKFVEKVDISEKIFEKRQCDNTLFVDRWTILMYNEDTPVNMKFRSYLYVKIRIREFLHERKTSSCRASIIENRNVKNPRHQRLQSEEAGGRHHAEDLV